MRDLGRAAGPGLRPPAPRRAPRKTQAWALRPLIWVVVLVLVGISSLGAVRWWTSAGDGDQRTLATRSTSEATESQAPATPADPAVDEDHGLGPAAVDVVDRFVPAWAQAGSAAARVEALTPVATPELVERLTAVPQEQLGFTAVGPATVVSADPGEAVVDVALSTGRTARLTLTPGPGGWVVDRVSTAPES